MVNLYDHFDLIGLFDSYRPICFYGGGAKVTQHNGIIQQSVPDFWFLRGFDVQCHYKFAAGSGKCWTHQRRLCMPIESSHVRRFQTHSTQWFIRSVRREMFENSLGVSGLLDRGAVSQYCLGSVHVEFQWSVRPGQFSGTWPGQVQNEYLCERSCDICEHMCALAGFFEVELLESCLGWTVDEIAIEISFLIGRESGLSGTLDHLRPTKFQQ